MWPQSVAQQLRARGHDVVAVVESQLRRQPDVEVFAAAQAEQRAIVTEDVRGYRRLAAGALQDGEIHAGVIFTSNQAFPRSNPRTPGRLVSGLHELLVSGVDLAGKEYWLA
jgi:nucleoside-diphosphate-sugar epimerase